MNHSDFWSGVRDLFCINFDTLGAAILCDNLDPLRSDIHTRFAQPTHYPTEFRCIVTLNCSLHREAAALLEMRCCGSVAMVLFAGNKLTTPSPLAFKF